jgi:hypothetical protein
MANSWWPTAGNGGDGKHGKEPSSAGGAAQGPASCPFCGAGNSKRSLVCWSCGKPLSQSAIDEAAKQKEQSEEDAYRRDYEAMQKRRLGQSGGVEGGAVAGNGGDESCDTEEVCAEDRIPPSWRLDDEKIEMPAVHVLLYYFSLVMLFIGFVCLVTGIVIMSAVCMCTGVSMMVSSLFVNLFLGIWSSTERTATYMRQIVELMKKETSQGSVGEC